MLAKLAAARPSFERIRKVLQQITSQSIQDLPGPFAALASASAAITESQRRLEADQERRKRSAQSRYELLHHAYAELRANLQRLFAKIQAAAPAAKTQDVPGQQRCELGEGVLEVKFGGSNAYEPGLFKESKWDVVGFCTISVGQQRPEYVWRASLWFMELPNGADYRWFEASYWEWTSDVMQPFALGPDRDADYAASNITHSVSLAFGPLAIDGEDEDAFHERWVLLLSRASVGQLRQPSAMPIRQWPPVFQ